MKAGCSAFSRSTDLARFRSLARSSAVAAGATVLSGSGSASRFGKSGCCAAAVSVVRLLRSGDLRRRRTRSNAVSGAGACPNCFSGSGSSAGSGPTASDSRLGNTGCWTSTGSAARLVRSGDLRRRRARSRAVSDVGVDAGAGGCFCRCDRPRYMACTLVAASFSRALRGETTPNRVDLGAGGGSSSDVADVLLSSRTGSTG